MAVPAPARGPEAEPYRADARRITLTLFTAQSLGSAGFLAASTVNAIVGAEISGRVAWAGLPMAAYQGGMALAAYGWGRAMDLLGRRHALALGLFSGVTGASLAGAAVVVRSFPMLLLGLVLMGAANSALQLGRFVAAEVNPPHRRARAIASVVVGGTVGAVLGPLLVGPTGRLAAGRGLDELSGPYGASAALFAIAAAVVLARLRPEPGELGRAVAALYADPGAALAPARPLLALLREGGVRLAMTSIVFAHVVMIMLMVITSLHMKGHDHALSSISFVISSHVIGMYAFSPLTGRAADRWGRPRVIAAGAGVLVVSGLLAPLSPRAIPLAVALFLLGLGWNLCYVGGSALLSDHLRPAERARTQGLNDLLMGAVSALGSVGSGFVFAAIGYGVMGLVSAAAALVPLLLSLPLGMRREPPPATAS